MIKRQIMKRFLCAVALCCLIASNAVQAAEVVALGAGSYLRGLPDGAKGPDAAPRMTANAAKLGKMPTNDWWSAVAWSEKPFTMFPHPLAVTAHAAGLRIAYPGSRITANEAGIFGAMPGGLEDMVISQSGVQTFAAPLVDDWNDWFVTLLFENGERKLRLSFGHGSPYVFGTVEGGAAQLRFAAPPKVWSGDDKSATLGISCGGRHYGLFAPTGGTWQGLGTATLTAQSDKNYFSVALLPDDRPETLAMFAKYAHAHVTDTRVSWNYDSKTQTVTTTYAAIATPREGTEKRTLFALYPHQWRHLSKPYADAKSPQPRTYGSVRGPMQLVEGTQFQTVMTFPGVLPWLPETGAVPRETLTSLLTKDSDGLLAGNPADTYWEGKNLGRAATLAALADVSGQEASAAAIRTKLRERLESWFRAQTATGNNKTRGVFAYEPRWGTLIGYPASYGSDDQLNDHHFHYGYYLKAAAEVARHDPAWASDARFGAMLKLLVRDVANPRRDDAEFPFMRCFDLYAGHSWASGHARFGDGNNNESSSEAMNAWAGFVLLGQATGDAPLRDLGVWLFTTELAAIEEYWFGVHGDTFPANYPASEVSMIWGGKGAHATWFSGDPEMIHGIEWLPVTGASLYLGHYPEYTRKNYEALVAERIKKSKLAPDAKPSWNGWADLIWMYRAFSDSGDAVAQYEAASNAEKAGGKFPMEAGNSRTALAYWIYTLDKLGPPDRAVTADTPLYAVFAKNGKRSYAACNDSDKDLTVHFSDGATLDVKAHTTACHTATP